MKSKHWQAIFRLNTIAIVPTTQKAFRNITCNHRHKTEESALRCALRIASVRFHPWFASDGYPLEFIFVRSSEDERLYPVPTGAIGLGVRLVSGEEYQQFQDQQHEIEQSREERKAAELPMA